MKGQPRFGGLALDPDGAFLVADERSDSLVSYAVDGDSGRLTLRALSARRPARPPWSSRNLESLGTTGRCARYLHRQTPNQAPLVVFMR